MGISWRTFEVPKHLEVDKSTLKENYGKFVAEPFEKGFGITLGNSLRRVLYSSIEGTAITSVKIESALHEFSAVDGVLEDVSQIILNLKNLIFKYHGKGPKTITLKIKKKGDVTAADITTDDTVEIINKDLHICNLTKETEFFMEMEIGKGRGFVSAEKNKKEDAPIGAIPIDSIYSPVKKVNFNVEETRVGQQTDFDRLVIEVWTDTSVSPEEAMLYGSNILQRHLDIFVNYGEIPIEEDEEESEEIDSDFQDLINKPITELELSVRSANCLEAADIKTIGDLIERGEQQMLKYKNFGKKSLSEISSILAGMGLGLGMDIQKRLNKADEA